MSLLGKPGVGLTIGIPTLGRPVSLEWATSFKGLNPPINFKSFIAQIYGQHVAIARNAIVRAAIKQGSKYLFFLSDDVIVPPHTLRQFIFRMEHDEKLGVVGGVYCSKSNPPFPLVFQGNGNSSYWDWKIGEYFPVTGLGMDCTMIRVELLKEMSLKAGEWVDKDTEEIREPERPLDYAPNDYEWFETVDEDEFLDGTNNAVQWTEDLRFLDKVAKTDWSIYCDSMVIAEHYEITTGQKFNLPADSNPMRHGKTEPEKKIILDLGCGTSTPAALFEEGQVIRVDIREEVNPDYRCDLRQLLFGNDYADIVFSCHVLEHFSRAEMVPLLTEWLRVLKPGGEFRIVVPNLSWAIKQISEDSDWFKDSSKDKHILNVLYGAQENPFDKHFNGFTPERLFKVLEDIGLDKVTTKIDEFYNLFGSGTKLDCSKPELVEDKSLRTAFDELEEGSAIKSEEAN